MPIRTPRLTIRPKEVGDGAITSAAVAETWEELNRWMRWAENREAFTAELLEIRNRQVMASFLLREAIELIGIETQTGKAVVWCGFHDIDWKGFGAPTRMSNGKPRCILGSTWPRGSHRSDLGFDPPVKLTDS